MTESAPAQERAAQADRGDVRRGVGHRGPELGRCAGVAGPLTAPPRSAEEGSPPPWTPGAAGGEPGLALSVIGNVDHEL